MFYSLNSLPVRHCALTLWLGLAAATCASAQEAAPPGAPVSVAEVRLGIAAQEVNLVGTAAADRIAVVAAEVAGPVAEVHVREGDLVYGEEALVTIRKVPFELDVRRFRASLEAARYRHEEAKDDLERQRQLLAEGVVSERVVVAAEKREQSLFQQTRELSASLAWAQDRLDRSVVRAPFDGTVVSVDTEVGEWLDESDPVVRLVDLSLIEVTLPLPERYLRRVSPGDPMQVRIPFAREEPYEGRVRAVLTEATPNARSFPLMVDVPNEDGRIRSGMSALARLRLAEGDASFLVPKDALVNTPTGKGVYAVRDSQATFVPVVTGEAVDGSIEVRGELKEGERVVVRGNERLREGQPVRILGDLTKASR